MKLGRLIPLLSLVVVGWFVVGIGSAYADTTSAISACQVTLSTTATTATAHIVSGCVAGNGVTYRLSSWSSSVPVAAPYKGQHPYASVTESPWVVQLPPCYWQVDFGQLTPGAHHVVASAVGGQACTTPTTVPLTTTTTTVARQPAIPVPATSTTVAKAAPAATPTPKSLAFTGRDMTVPLVAGLSAIAVGTLLVAGMRRRRWQR